MAWVIVRLKARLLGNAIGSDTTRLVMFVVTVVMGAVIALGGFLLLFSVRMSATAGPPLVTVGCAALLVGWLLFPILGFGSDETLDPLKLALFPIPRRRLMAGLLGAGFVGVPAIASVVTVAGAVFGYGRGAGLALTAATGATLLFVCVAGSRAIVTLLAPALRSRRGRDVMLLAGAVVGSAFYATQLLLPRGDGDPDRTLRQLRSAADVLRWTPFGWAGDAFVAAGDGRYGVALLELAGLAAFGLLLVWVWAASLDRAMTAGSDSAPDAGSEAAGELAPRLLRGVLPGGRVGAVAARELRYLSREPRRRAQTFGSVVFASVLPLVSMRGMSGGRPYALLYPGVILGLSAANQIGLDGPAFWLHVATAQTYRADIVGKNLATALFSVPVLAVGAAVSVLFGSAPADALTFWLLAVGGFGVSLGFANVASVRAPFPMPETGNPWATGGGQGCATGIYSFVALLGSMLLLVPSLLLVVLGDGSVPLTVLGIVLALGIGAGGWWGGVAYAARDLDRRAPEVLAAIDPRRA